MSDAWQRVTSTYRRLSPSTAPVVIIFLGVCLANVLYLVGFSQINPISWTANVAQILCHVSCGRSMIDPNVGYITQPLGHLAAEDLLHGHLPFWNYFEGLGQPLAGEMQSAALFPLTVLFALPSGLLWFHMSLEFIAGVATYFLARRLSMPLFIATAAGLLFALNGTFGWIGNAVLNPIAFLPMLLLGIEMIYSAASTSSPRRAWYVAAIAIALSLYAGFPEVAYVDGLFCLGWALVRLFSLERSVRWMAVRRVSLAGVVGVLLSLPILIPFLDFLKVAYVGPHTQGGESLIHLPIHGLSMFIDPYIYGGIFSNVNTYNIWGGIGGYFTVSVLALALLGLWGARYRSLRIFLGCWAFFGTLAIFNLLYVHQILNILPEVKNLALSRYLMPSCEFSLITLAALGIWDLTVSARAKRLINATNLLSLLLLIAAALGAHSLNEGIVNGLKARILLMVLHAAPFVVMAVLIVIGIFAHKKFAAALVALVVVVEALFMFVVPSAEAAKSINVDTGIISYLQRNEGEYRFLDFGVLDANWASEYNLNSLSAIDLPFPSAYSNFIQRQLFPGLNPANQFVINDGVTGIDDQETELAEHFQAYEDASVKYLVLNDKVPLLASLKQRGVRAVYEDPLGIATVYQLPHPRTFYSTSATCTLQSGSVDAATVTCAKATTLVRTELSMKGWRAFVNGAPVSIHTRAGVYQTIRVPAGTSTVTFTFTPPREKYAILIAVLAALFLLGAWLYDRLPDGARRRKRQGARHTWRERGPTKSSPIP